MINRKNKKIGDEYLEYRLLVDQQDPKSIRLERSLLKHILTWCDETEFCDAPKHTELFRNYAIRQTKASGGPLSQNHKKKLIETGKHLFSWLSIHKTGYRLITPAWLATFKYKSVPALNSAKKSVSEEEIIFLSKLPARNLLEQRIRAGVCLLYLSGARIDAFVTLPLKAIQITELKVQQFPSLGVRTKNKKSATTFLIELDHILQVVQEWDHLVRSELHPTSFWFAPFSPKTGGFDIDATTVGEHRATIFRKNLKNWLKKNEVIEGFSPHDFRRGHANFLFDRAVNIGDILAAQENLMHDSLTTTEKYARQREDQTRQHIKDMSHREISSFPKDNLSGPQLDVLIQEIQSLKQLLMNQS